MKNHRVNLRSVLFHEIADTGSTFTDGLGVRMQVETFRSRVSFLKKYYNVVSGDDVRSALDGDALPSRALLITFDDAYASVAQIAAGVLDDAKLPAIFFVNSGFVDHRALGTDNLVAHVANTVGLQELDLAVERVFPQTESGSISAVLRELVPTLTLEQVAQLRASLEQSLPHDPLAEARDQGLYLTDAQLADLPSAIEIGSHTANHVRCRMLQPGELTTEIDDNRRALQTHTRSQVRSFSVPYGSANDLTTSVSKAVSSAGHDLTFLVEGRLNHGPLQADRLLRVSLHAPTNLRSSLEIEVLPRLRYARDLVKGAA